MKVGDMVKLKSDTSNNFEIAVIEISLHDIIGGFKLDRPIGGFRYWNKDDLTLVANLESRIRSKM